MDHIDIFWVILIYILGDIDIFWVESLRLKHTGRRTTGGSRTDPALQGLSK